LAPSQLPLGDGLEHAPPDRTTSRYSPISNPELDGIPSSGKVKSLETALQSLRDMSVPEMIARCERLATEIEAV